MKRLLIKPSMLSGKIIAPPSKSMSHRAIICASLCDGQESIIKNVMMSEDIAATVQAMKALGASIIINQDINNRFILTIKGKSKKVQEAVINCNESGSTLRFLIPVAAVIAKKSKFTGNGRLVERPLDTYYKIFNEKKISYSNTSGRLPLFINSTLTCGSYEIEGNVSSQFISGLMLALPLTGKESRIIITTNLESRAYIDLTIDMLNKFGISIINNDYKEFIIQDNSLYKAYNYDIEADYSQAAFFLVAAALGNNLAIEGLDDKSLQGDKGIVDIIRELNDDRNTNYTIDASDIPDLVPIISVLASLKPEKTTKIINAKRLRIKESDRLHAITGQLNLLGADLTELEDGIIIKGRSSLKGNAIVNSFNDHRIAMSIAIAATCCRQQIVLEGYEAVNKSYPDFWADYKKIGGQISELSMG